jgi:hypothetical protein
MYQASIGGMNLFGLFSKRPAEQTRYRELGENRKA